MRIYRLLRGVLRTALTWAAAWVPLSLLPFTIVAISGGQLPSRRLLAVMVLSQAIVGAINGAVFASILAIAARRRTFATLRLGQMALWGAVGGALFPFVARAILLATADIAIPAAQLVATIVGSAVLGAGCGALTLSLARRAPADVPRIDAGTPTAIDAVNSLGHD